MLVGTPEDLRDGEVERLRRLGVEHLLSTVDLDSLADRVREAEQRTGPDPQANGAGPVAPAPADGDRARVVAVWGPAGAPGRTTVAVGLAAETARAGRDTFLLDVDPYGGAVAQHLGVLDEVSGLLAAARSANSGLLDPDRLSAYARQVDDRLRVLTGLPRADRWAEVRPAAFEQVLDEATRLAGPAGLVVLDTGFSLENDLADPFAAAPQRNRMTLDAVRAADEVLVVGAADPVGLARLARGLVELRDAAPRGASARRGQPHAAVAGLERPRDHRDGRGLRDTGRRALPARRPPGRGPGPDGGPEPRGVRGVAVAYGDGRAREQRARVARRTGRAPRPQAPKSR